MTNPRFDLAVLLDMLTYCRPARSLTTIAFNDRFIKPLSGAELDRHGNWHVRVGDSPILWSAHSDTVHRSPGRQTVHYDPLSGLVQLSKRSRKSSACLGADDTAGVFLLWSLIQANVPGHYVFHYAEEIGGIGSDDLAEHSPELIAGSQFAIALDRRGHSSVITKQWSRTCSDAFADSLAVQLNAHGLTFAPDPTGTFTDTANYTRIIPECTNLSVGYANAHSPRETLDVHFLRRLLPALATIDPSALVSERLVTEEEEEEYVWTYVGRKAEDVITFPREHKTATALDGFHTDSECFVCGYWYDSRTSSAKERTVYCCDECEDYDLLDRATKERSADDPYTPIYLDEVYADVQDAIAESIAALREQRNRRH